MTIAQRVVDELKENPKQTCTELAKKLGQSAATVSSEMCRMAKRGILARENGQGTRGGHIYWVPNDNRPAQNG